MFYDLNIALPDAAGKPQGHISSADWAQIVQTIEHARDLGYQVVALNQIIQGKLVPDHLNIWKSVPSIEKARFSWDTANKSTASGQVPRGHIRVLRRLTVVMSDVSQGHTLSSSGNSVANEYDIVAVRPTTEKLLSTAGTGAWDSVDLISLDMGNRWGFFAKYKAVGQSLHMGQSFEISYQPALGDSSTRQQWVSNASSIVRATRGKGVVWTSGARDPQGLRPPYDIANLGDAVQLNRDLSKRGLSSNARAALIHAFTRTNTVRAVISASKPLEKAGSDDTNDTNGDDLPAAKRARVKRK